MSSSSKKTAQKLKLLCPDICRWGEGLPREGAAAKSSACPSKPRETKLLAGPRSPGRLNFWAGYPRILPRCPRGTRKA